MNSDTSKTFVKMIMGAMDYSSAHALLIFSGALVITSILKAPDYILLSFFALFFALINHNLRVIRKSEDLGDYAVGNNLGLILYTIISWLLLIWWVAGTIFLLTGTDLVYLFFTEYRFILWPVSLWTVFAAALAVFLLWMVIIFSLKINREKNTCAKGDALKCYNVRRFCKNCDFSGQIEIPKESRFQNHPCPQCQLTTLVREKDFKKLNES